MKSSIAENVHKSTNSEELTITAKNVPIKIPQIESDDSTRQKYEENKKVKCEHQFKKALKKKIHTEKVVPLKSIKNKKISNGYYLSNKDDLCNKFSSQENLLPHKYLSSDKPYVFSTTKPPLFSSPCKRPRKLQVGQMKGFMIRSTRRAAKRSSPALRIHAGSPNTKSADQDSKRSQSSLCKPPAGIYEENAFEDLGKKRFSVFENEMGRSVTVASGRNQGSTSPMGDFMQPVSKRFMRRSTMPIKAVDKLSDQHTIKNRKEFEDALTHVFDKEIANKSLNRKSRVSEDILLDSHAFGKQNTMSYKDPSPEQDDKLSSSNSSACFDRMSPRIDFSKETVCFAKVGKKTKKLVIRKDKDMMNIRITRVVD